MDRSEAGVTVKPRSMVDVLRGWSQAKPNATAVTLLNGDGGATAVLTFRELDRAARRVAASLRAAGAQRLPILLPAESTISFVTGLCGCLYAGCIATPVPPAIRNSGFERMGSIIANAGVAHAIATGPASLEIAKKFVALMWIAGCDAAEDAEPPAIEPHAPTLLQYTSGSTGSPKGVVITHHNLCSNLGMLKVAFGAEESSRVLSWLPLYHDMGLIAHLLLSLYCGAGFYSMSPLAFVQKPQRWLTAISTHRATISGAPNFAYELCTRRMASSIPAGLDLSSWKVASCGAEPVRLATLQRFTKMFSPYGLASTALLPCYGLAEATVFVTGGPAGASFKVLGDVANDSGARAQLVSCGSAVAALAIVDPGTHRRVADGTEGEIWVRGNHVAAGYWNNIDAQSFGARIEGEQQSEFLRTGDLGITRGGHLFVTGRLKDLIIHRGVKLHSEDIEGTVARSDPRFGMIGAAFSIESSEQEQVVAVFEVARRITASDVSAKMAANATAAVANAHGVRLFDLVLVLPGRIPRTTSGKVQRGRCRDQYLLGKLCRQ